MISFPQLEVIGACVTFGPQLSVPSPLNGEAVMQAIASNESSLGANCGPRYEPAYGEGGRYANAALLSQYGDAAASSHGPWQMMFENFSPEAQQAIADGSADVTAFAQEFVRFFNSYVIRIRGAANLNEIGQVWNGGHVFASSPPVGVTVYCTKLARAYESSLPKPPESA